MPVLTQPPQELPCCWEPPFQTKGSNQDANHSRLLKVCLKLTSYTLLLWTWGFPMALTFLCYSHLHYVPQCTWCSAAVVAPKASCISWRKRDSYNRQFKMLFGIKYAVISCIIISASARCVVRRNVHFAGKVSISLRQLPSSKVTYAAPAADSHFQITHMDLQRRMDEVHLH